MDEFIRYVEDHGLQMRTLSLYDCGVTKVWGANNDGVHNIRSISKVISCILAGKAIEQGLLSLDTRVMDIIDWELVHNEVNRSLLKEIKVSNLLDLTIGINRGLMFSKDMKAMPSDTDYISYVLNYPITHKPGTFFVYTNAATYLLCYILGLVTGRDMLEWAQECFFDTLDIKNAYWERSNQGICLGASGLFLSNADMHKVGMLLLNEGIYKDQRVISSSWIKQMKTPHYFTADLPEYAKKQSRCINKMSYGYGLWICGDGSTKYPKTHFFCDGTDGQFLIVCPDLGRVISITSEQKDMSPYYEGLRLLVEE